MVPQGLDLARRQSTAAAEPREVREAHILAGRLLLAVGVITE